MSDDPLQYILSKDEWRYFKECEVDAVRYRWLRTNALDCQETEGLEIVRLIPAHRSPNHADIDRSIDAVMANVEFSGGAPLHGAASAGTPGYATEGEK